MSFSGMVKEETFQTESARQDTAGLQKLQHCSVPVAK